MYLENIRLKGYRAFKDEFSIKFEPGLNVLIGENASGKSTIIDAIRLILCEDEYGRNGIEESDFHKPLDQPTKFNGVDRIWIKCEFENLSDEEQVAYLPWLDLLRPSRASLNLAILNKEDSRGRFKRKIWGNESEAGLFEWELLNKICCIYLPPLRNAEEKLRAYKGSRLARLLKNLRKDNDDEHPLEKKFAAINSHLITDPDIQQANTLIKENIIKSVGSVFGQDASLQFTEVNFDRIVEKIRLLFYPALPGPNNRTPLNMFRELSENSLGFNNILYLATILAELEGRESPEILHKVLLIEEPEAHLHPQLQIKLLQYLEDKARENKIQIIVTTHSTTFASCVNLNSLKVLSKIEGHVNPVFTSIANCGLSDSTKDFLQRWLDITKSILFFAKGILFVEGIAEALVIKELAKIVLKDLSKEHPEKIYYTDLEEYGISIVNLNGIYFKHFLPLFQGYRTSEGEMGFIKCAGIPIRCAAITDNDPLKESRPTKDNSVVGNNPHLELIKELEENSDNCRMFTNLKTFEYDLALEGSNLTIMLDTMRASITTNGPIKQQIESYSRTNWNEKTSEEKAGAAHWLLTRIENDLGKGEYAQALSLRLAKGTSEFVVPNYIADAIKWLVE